jgi:probable rRNA maturation factor
MPAGIFVENRQRAVRFDLRWVRRFAQAALAECGEALPHIEVAIVSDRTIARVHRQFMQIEGATDVITFDHGEIVIGAGTARRQAREFSQPLEHELGRYIIHGLLHLAGYDDRTSRDRAGMHRMQERVMKTCLARLAAT